ncbi:MAG TPA: tail fiber domain-containing protein [Candidatus Udaeobacter sp.]|nr:tail fiber domain-containing protein [Candidatus Udaeobacter sp.]
MNPLTHSQNATIPPLLIALVLVSFWLEPMAQAVGPDTEGAIPGSNNGEGIGVLVSRTAGVWNTGSGFEALNHLTAGNQNTATGLRALFSDINGGFNTATGVYSLFGNTSGFFNSATGAYALAHNTTGSNNTANGYGALYFNSEGEFNTATGAAALYKNTIGDGNTATGYLALFSNTTGTANTAIGESALDHNTTGNNNTANGNSALSINTTGNNNTATGYAALYNNTTANGNTALGFQAGFNQATGGNNIYIGDLGFDGEFDVIAIGGIPAGDAYQVTYIGGIFGTTTFNPAIPVLIAENGQLGTVSSSRRFKKDIKSMDKASEAILALNPVTFHYKTGAGGTPQFGLIAEEVAAVNPDLVVRDNNGEIYTVRYDAVNAMLLNEFLKEHKKVDAQNRRIQEQETTITQLKKEMETVVARLKEQDSKIQTVSDQIELSKPAPQMVEYNP